MVATVAPSALRLTRPVAAVPVPPSPRLAYVDSLRVLLATLVILVHLAIQYGVPWGWYYNEAEAGETSPLLAAVALFIAICQSFFMGLFFLIAGYFTPGCFDRKGVRAYLVGRLQRLGVPLLVYVVAINPLLVYACQVRAGYQGSLWQFLVDYVTHASTLGVMPLWFVEALLLFAVAYAIWRRLTRHVLRWSSWPSRAPGHRAIVRFALGLGLATFALRIWVPVGWFLEPLHLQLAHFPQYVALFVVGVVAYRRGWLETLGHAQGRADGGVALTLAVLSPVLLLAGGAAEQGVGPFMAGFRWQALAYALWEQSIGVAVIIALLVWFRGRLNRQGRLLGVLSGDTYAVYFLHAPIIVLLGLAVGGVTMDPGLKLVLVAPAAVALCFLVGHFARKLPGARSIL